MAPLVFEMFMGTILITTNLNLHTHTQHNTSPVGVRGQLKGAAPITHN